MTNPPAVPFSPLSKITLLAVTEALEACFDAAAWTALSVELEIPQLGDPEMGFQRALRFGDDDYGYQVAQFVTFMEHDNPSALRALANRPALSTWLLDNAPNAAQELGLVPAELPIARDSSAVPEATDHAPTHTHPALHANDAAIALDSAHTALHRCLRDACTKAQVTVPANASISMLFNALRNRHPAMAAIAQRNPHVDVVLGSLSVALTAIGALRGDVVSTQPHQASLDGPEAMLMAELMGALARYLEASR